MKSIAVTVTTSPTLLVASDDLSRICYIHSGTGSIYLGGADVTSTTGIHLANGETISIQVPFKETVYGITSSSTNTARVLTPDVD